MAIWNPSGRAVLAFPGNFYREMSLIEDIALDCAVPVVNLNARRLALMCSAPPNFTANSSCGAFQTHERSHPMSQSSMYLFSAVRFWVTYGDATPLRGQPAQRVREWVLFDVQCAPMKFPRIHYTGTVNVVAGLHSTIRHGTDPQSTSTQPRHLSGTGVDESIPALDGVPPQRPQAEAQRMMRNARTDI